MPNLIEMPPEPKLSVFDLTDIEDIDAFSDGLDADPSSDDETFKSHKSGTKRITKKRLRAALPIISNGHEIGHATNVAETNGHGINDTHETDSIKSDADKTPIEGDKAVKANGCATEDTGAKISEQTAVKNVTSAKQEQAFVMDAPTDHFDELERQINGPDRWNMTSSSAENSEDELGGLERDEFSFKMCQIMRRGRHHRNKKTISSSAKSKVSAPETPKKSLEVLSESESDTENFEKFKFCTRNVPMAVLNEDDL
uniref:BLVR domain-containing protein n=1 Tax=Panagrellus redivivus TaxID=6233 RepID=A0A7E4URZ3_PANRE